MKRTQEISGGIFVILLAVLLGLAPVKEVFNLKWGVIGVQMAEAGVIDMGKFPNFYNGKKLVINSENQKVALNTLWAFGLSNKNPILESGPMMDKQYGGGGNFASTGGWTLGEGTAMDHYSMHSFVTLTPEQQVLLERVTKNIYRPCCKNSTYFPDCNHGMAMLGLMELMASQGTAEDDMYKKALEVNTLWFPGQSQKVSTGCAV